MTTKDFYPPHISYSRFERAVDIAMQAEPVRRVKIYDLEQDRIVKVEVRGNLKGADRKVPIHQVVEEYWYGGDYRLICKCGYEAHAINPAVARMMFDRHVANPERDEARG